jgi:hypothetical protein
MCATRREMIAMVLNIALPVACRRQPVEREVSMTVELDVYSGRPNPTWSLSAQEAEQVASLLANLPSSESAAEEGLGYRGFILLNTRRAGNLPERLRVSRGVVTLYHDERAEHFVDANGLEKRLLEQAREHGFGSVLDAVRPE